MAIQAGRKGVKKDAVDLYGNVKPPEYELPVASADKLGGVKIGSNINVASDGTISTHEQYVLPTASADTKGGVKIGSGIDINDGVISNGYTLPTASDNVLGGVKVGDGLKIASGVLSVDKEFTILRSSFKQAYTTGAGWKTINSGITPPLGQYLCIASFGLPVNTDVCMRIKSGATGSGSYGAGMTASGLQTPNPEEAVLYMDVVSVTTIGSELKFEGYLTGNQSASDEYDVVIMLIPLGMLLGAEQVYSSDSYVSTTVAGEWATKSLTTLNKGTYLFVSRVTISSGTDCCVKYSFNDSALNGCTATGLGSTSTNSLGVLVVWVQTFSEDNNVVGLNVMTTPTRSSMSTLTRIFKLD